MTNICCICTSYYTKELRMHYECTHCHFICCMSCVIQFMNIYNISVCMSCKQPFIFEDVYSSNSKKFIKSFKQIKQTELFNFELSMMIDTQPYVLYKSNISHIKQCIQHKEELLIQLYHDYYLSCNDKPYIKKQIIVEKSWLQINYLKVSLWKKNYQMDNTVYSYPSKYTQPYNCPDIICNGYILLESNICGICNRHFCQLCHTNFDHNHICNSDNIKCIKLIQDTTKPCPICNIPIQRIHGCDHMWCVQCKNAFMWESGTIIHGIVHNPHYNEYIENSEDKIVDVHDLQTIDVDTLAQNTLLKCHAFMLNVREYLMYTPLYENNFNTNLDLRMQWISKDISSYTFKTYLYKRYKKHNVKSHLHTRTTTFINDINDSLKLIIKQNDIHLYTNIKNRVNEFNSYMHSYHIKVKYKTPHISFKNNEFMLNYINCI
jgi:hypothetical protein